MRYAPTPVRLYFGIDWFVCRFRFRSLQGVCDTPLHLFDGFLGLIGLVDGSVFAHLRAYAIRPYTYSIVFGDLPALIPFIYIPCWDDIYFDDGDDGVRGKFVLL